jgi:hypothetical protein
VFTCTEEGGVCPLRRVTPRRTECLGELVGHGVGASVSFTIAGCWYSHSRARGGGPSTRQVPRVCVSRPLFNRFCCVATCLCMARRRQGEWKGKGGFGSIRIWGASFIALLCFALLCFPSLYSSSLLARDIGSNGDDALRAEYEQETESLAGRWRPNGEARITRASPQARWTLRFTLQV